MLKKMCGVVLVASMAFLMSGCGAILAAAVAAASGYGIYQATKK